MLSGAVLVKTMDSATALALGNFLLGLGLGGVYPLLLSTAMDLDADGTVDRAELAVTQRAASAASRGRMERQFLAADLDGDGAVDAGEIAADGQAAAIRALGEGEADLLRSLLRLDADGDGALTAQEVQAAVKRMDQES